jgi:hypothetical protein
MKNAGTALATLAMLLFSLAACERKGPAERMGEAIDDRVERTGKSIEDAAEDVADELEDFADDVEDAFDD